MADVAAFFTIQIIDSDGTPAGLCYVQAFEPTGMSRKAIWTDYAKTLPSGSGTLADLDGDDTGRVTFYGDGRYLLKFRAAGDDGSNTPLLILYDVDLTIAEPVYTGDTTDFDLAGFEERTLAGQGRQAVQTQAQQSGTAALLRLSRFDVAGSTYLAEGPASFTTYKQVTTEDYDDGARITVMCLTNPLRLRAKRSGDDSSHNLEIGGDFLMSVGSSIDLELLNDVWYERSRFFYDTSYENMQNTGIASAGTIIAPGRAVKITGTATINNIRWIVSGEPAPPGQRLDLYFTAGAIVGDNTGNVNLEGTFTGQAGATLSLISTGTGWKEICRTGYVAPNVTQTLDAPDGSGRVSVAGTYEVYFTGENFDDIEQLTNPGTLGRIILIRFNGTLTDSPSESYTDCRKYVRDTADTGAGYIRLKPRTDFGTLPGDWLRLQLLLDESDVLYWEEIDRFEVATAPDDSAIVPRIDQIDGSIDVWRPSHRLRNASGDTVDIDTITPVPTPHRVVTLFYDGDNNYSFNEDGNLWVASGSEIVMDEAGESFTFMSLALNGSKGWVQIDSGSAVG